jgi:hypothetical protein
VIERIFAEYALATRFIEGDQTSDHFARRRSLPECNRLLVGNAACPGMNGDVLQTELFDAAVIMAPVGRSL